MIFTDRSIRNLQHPKDSRWDRTYFDARYPGFGIRVYPSGRKCWVVMVRPKTGGKLKRIALGKYPKVSLSSALKAAKVIFGLAAHNRLHAQIGKMK